MDEKPEPLWGVDEVARFLRGPVTTIYQWRHHAAQNDGVA